MRTDLEAIVSDPEFATFSIEERARIVRDAQPRKPLVTADAIDPPAPKRARSIVEKRTEANDPLAPLLPKPRPVPPGARRVSAAQKKVDALAGSKMARRIGSAPAEPEVPTADQMLRTAGEEAIEQAKAGVTGLVGRSFGEVARAGYETSHPKGNGRPSLPDPVDRRIKPKTLVESSARDKTMAEQAKEYIAPFTQPAEDAITDITGEGGYLDPRDPRAITAVRGTAGAIGGTVGAIALDPLGDLAFGGALKGAAMGGQAIAARLAKRAADAARAKKAPRASLTTLPAPRDLTDNVIQRAEMPTSQSGPDRSSVSGMPDKTAAPKDAPQAAPAETPKADPPPLLTLAAKLGAEPWQMPREEFLRRRPKPARNSDPPDLNLMMAFVNQDRQAGAPNSVEIVPMAGPGMVGEIPGFKVVVARGSDGQPIGALNMMPNEHGQLDLINVAVHPAHRRQGVATRLYNAAREAGYDVDKASGIEGLTDEGAVFNHARLVRQAVDEGKPVPPEVLSDYPHLVSQAAPRGGGHLDRLVTSEEGSFRPGEFGRALQGLFGDNTPTPARLADSDRPAPAESIASLTPEERRVLESRRARLVENRKVFEENGATAKAAEYSTLIDEIDGRLSAASPEPAVADPSRRSLQGRLNRLRQQRQAAIDAGDMGKAGEFAGEIQRVEQQMAPPEARAQRVAPDSVAASLYQNFAKFGGSAGESEVFQKVIQESVSEMARDPLVRTTRQMVIDDAAAYHPALLDQVAKSYKWGDAITPGARQAMRDRVKTLSGIVDQKQAEVQDLLRGPQGAESRVNINRLEQEIDQHKADARAYVDVLIPARSQDGRNLAFHAMTASGAFEPDYWLGKARRIATGDPMMPLKPDVEERIGKSLSRGQRAQDRLAVIIQELEARGISDHGVSKEGRVLMTVPPQMDDRGMLDRLWSQVRGLFVKDDGAFDVGAFRRWVGERQARNRVPRAVEQARAHHPDPEVDALLREAQALMREVRGSRADLASEMATLEKTPHATFISSLLKANMLTGIGTAQINLFGPPSTTIAEGFAKAAAWPADLVLSAWNKNSPANPYRGSRSRSIQGASLIDMAHASHAAATKGVREAMEVMKHGMTREQMEKVDVKRELNGDLPLIGKTANAVLSGYGNLIFRLVSAPDRISRAYALEASLREQAAVYARNVARSKPGTDWTALANELYEQAVRGDQNPTTIAIAAQAMIDAEQAVLANPTMAGDALQWLGGGNMRGKTGESLYRAAADIPAPFKQIPSAGGQRTVDFSGFGAVVRAVGASGELERVMKEGLTLEEQRAISLAFGRGAVGVATMHLGMILGEKGLMTGVYDPEMRATYEASGRLPGSIRTTAIPGLAVLVGDRWVPIAMLPPFGPLLAVGATLGKPVWDPSRTAAAVWRGITEGPLTQTVRTVGDFPNDPAGATAKIVGGYTSRFVPSAVGDVANFRDDRGGQPLMPREFPDSAIGGIQAKIPGQREQMPIRSDALGRDVEGKSGWGALWRFMGKEAREDSDPLLRELLRLGMNLPAVTREIPLVNQDDVPVKVPLSTALADDLYRHQGRAIDLALNEVLRDPDFQDIKDDELRRKVLRGVMDEVRTAARDEWAEANSSAFEGLLPQAQEAAEIKANRRRENIAEPAQQESAAPWHTAPNATVPRGARRSARENAAQR